MQNHIPLTIDGLPPEPDPPASRRRLWLVTGVGAVVLVLGGGAVAMAAGSSSSSPPAPNSSSTPGAGGPVGRGPAGQHKPHLDGTVKSVAGDKILITDHDGFTRTIKTGSTTKYTDSLTANPAVGVRIHAEGSVDADGVSLDATSIGTMPAPPAGGPGHGPRGGPRPNGPRPGAPTPSAPGSGAPSSAPGSSAPSSGTTSAPDSSAPSSGTTSAPSAAPSS